MFSLLSEPHSTGIGTIPALGSSHLNRGIPKALRNDRIRKNKKNYARPTRATSHGVLIRQWRSDSHLTYLFNTKGQNNLHMG
jgi:hypothetical protein